MANGTLSDTAKKCITWCIAICVVFGATALCIHSCKRNIQCTVNAKRNSVTIEYVTPNHNNLKKSK